MKSCGRRQLAPQKKRKRDAKPAIKMADLLPAPYNPRTISVDALAGLDQSLVEFGDIAGLVYNARSGNLICGHQRLRALQERWGDKLTIRGGAVCTPHGDRYPVRVVEWSPARERAANVAANNPHIAGVFDESLLRDVLSEIQSDETDAHLLEALRLDELVELACDATGDVGDAEEDPPRAPEAVDFRIIVACRDEKHQAALLQRFEREGLKCWSVVS